LNTSSASFDLARSLAQLMDEMQGEGVQAEDLTRTNLTAADNNPVIDSTGGVIDQLALLGFDPLAV
ncbi:MAG: hypothetical protein AAFV49_07975, partial [Pseudomonadota bacterium]